MAKIRFEDGTVVNFEGTPTKKDIEEVAAKLNIQKPAKQDGFFKSVAKEIARPLGELGTSAYNVAAATKDIITGDVKGANEALQAKRKLPFLGETRPAFTGVETPTEGVKKIGGYGAELGSYTIGGGAAKTLVKGGLKGAAKKIGVGALEAGTAGALSTGGRESQKQDSTVADIAKEATGGALFGAGLGGVIGSIPTVSKAVKQSTKFAVGKASGLSPSTVETAIKQGSALSKARASGITREVVGEQVQSVVDKLSEEIGDTGRLYDVIKQNTDKAFVPKGYWQEKLTEAGVKLKNGLVDRKNSVVMTKADKTAIDDFLVNYAREGAISTDDFLRARSGLTNVAKFDTSKSSASKDIAKSLRNSFNDIREQIPGLKDLDEQYAPLKEFLKELKGTVVDKSGDVKLSKVVNSLKKGREKERELLERLVPGITDDLSILSAIEDIEYAAGNKIGSYAQNIIFGGGAVTAATGNPILGVVATIVSNPKVIVPILETYSRANVLTKKIATSAIQKIQLGLKLSESEKNLIKKAMQFAAKRRSREKISLGKKDEMFGAVAGIEQDEEGNITYNPVKGALGAVGLGIAKKVPKAKIPLKKAVSKSDDLIREAKKYKSADDFIKAQGDVIYHTTGAEFDKFDKKFLGSNTGEIANNIEHGFFFATDKADIEAFKRTLSKGTQDFRGNKLEPKDVSGYRTIEKIVDKDKIFQLNEAKIRKGDITNKESEILVELFGTETGEALKGKKAKEYVVELFNEMDVGDLEDFMDNSSDELVKKLQKNGFVGYKSNFGAGVDEYVIFDPNKLPDKSQLEQIWKEANK